MDYRPTCLVRAPVATRSGYGEMSKDIIRHLIEMDKYDVKIQSVNWGTTPMDSLKESNPKDKIILDRIVDPRTITERPDLYISITIPNEFTPIGRYNIGITAGIETTMASHQWIEYMNIMDVTFVISNHAKDVFLNSKYEKRDQAGNTHGILECTKPIEVLHNCVDTHIFRKRGKHELDKTIIEEMNKVSSKFNFLFVGHWLKGNVGEDRKNVGLLVKIFFELFKRTQFIEKPGLVLKTSGGTYSVLDLEEIKQKIQTIRESVQLEKGEILPPVYVIHGDLTDSEMNSLYNHPNIKCHITLTHGEGFGRPLLEASLSGKPIIAPGWSGHVDFLNAQEALLVGGSLEKVPSNVVWENIIVPESSWMVVNNDMAASSMVEVFRNYVVWKTRANTLADKNKQEFSYNVIRKKFWDLLNKYVPEFKPQSKQISLNLPKLKKVDKSSSNDAIPQLPKLKLPQLKKVELKSE